MRRRPCFWPKTGRFYALDNVSPVARLPFTYEEVMEIDKVFLTQHGAC